MYDVNDPAVRERLVKLMEECAEVQQAAAKLLIHGTVGIFFKHPAEYALEPEIVTYDNVADLEREVGHLVFVIGWLQREGDLSRESVDRQAYVKGTTINQCLHHNTA